MVNLDVSNPATWISVNIYGISGKPENIFAGGKI